MKKMLFIVGIVFLIGFLIFLFLDKKQRVKNTPPKNETILIFGDSLAKGVGSTNGNDLAGRLSRKLNKKILNYGQSGDTTGNALERLPVAVNENPGIAIIILGGNDFLRKIPREETLLNLEKIITSFQDNGAAVVLVGVRSGLIGDGRGEDYSSIAEKTEAYYVPDILSGLFGDSRYMSDAVHPNDTGYALIEERFYPILIDLSDK